MEGPAAAQEAGGLVGQVSGRQQQALAVQVAAAEGGCRVVEAGGLGTGLPGPVVPRHVVPAHPAVGEVLLPGKIYF